MKGDGRHTEATTHEANVEFGFGDGREECSSWEGHKLNITVGGGREWNKSIAWFHGWKRQ
ncbi:hypothetical protein ACSBR2_013251 [Camellia fascicularis]